MQNLAIHRIKECKENFLTVYESIVEYKNKFKMRDDENADIRKMQEYCEKLEESYVKVQKILSDHNVSSLSEYAEKITDEQEKSYFKNLIKETRDCHKKCKDEIQECMDILFKEQKILEVVLAKSNRASIYEEY